MYGAFFALSDDDAIFNPIDAIRYLSTQREIPLNQLTVPQRIIGTYQRQTYIDTQKLIDGEVLEWWWHRGRLSVCNWHTEEIGLYYSASEHQQR
jgi:hypothetical protein